MRTLAIAVALSVVLATITPYPHWAEEYTAALKGYGVLPEKIPVPEEAVTYEELEYILARMFGREVQSLEAEPLTRLDGLLLAAEMFRLTGADPEYLNIFPDYYLVPEKHRETVAGMVAAGIVRGYYNEYEALILSPFSHLTHGQAAALLLNAAGTIISEAGGVSGLIASNALVNTYGVTFTEAAVYGQLLIAEGADGGETALLGTWARRVVMRSSGELIIEGSDVSFVELHPQSGARVWSHNNAPKVLCITGGMDTIHLYGEYFHVVVNSAAPVIIDGTIYRITVLAEGASVMLTTESVAQVIEIAGTAGGFTLHIDGEVDFLIAEGNYGHIFGNGRVHEKWLAGSGILVAMTDEATDDAAEISEPLIQTPAPTPCPPSPPEDDSSEVPPRQPTPMPTPTPTPIPSPDPGDEEPDNGEPDNGQPDNGQPDNGQPDNGQPDNGKPDNGQPDNGKPDNGQPDNGKPDNGQPDNGQPNNGQPDNGQPDNGQPDNGQPDNGQPDNGQPPRNPTVERDDDGNPIFIGGDGSPIVICMSQNAHLSEALKGLPTGVEIKIDEKTGYITEIIINDTGNLNIDDAFANAPAPVSISLGEDASISLEITVTPPAGFAPVNLSGIHITGGYGSTLYTGSLPLVTRISVGGSLTVDASGATQSLHLELMDSTNPDDSINLINIPTSSPGQFIYLFFPEGSSRINADVLPGLTINAMYAYPHQLRIHNTSTTAHVELRYTASDPRFATFRNLALTGAGQPIITIHYKKIVFDNINIGMVLSGSWPNLTV